MSGSETVTDEREPTSSGIERRGRKTQKLEKRMMMREKMERMMSREEWMEGSMKGTMVGSRAGF